MANKKYKDHTMGKGKARVTTNNQAGHDALEKLDWGHSPFKMNGFTYPGESPMTKKKGRDGKACWKGYTLRGTKKKGGRTVDNCVKVKRKK